MPPKKPNQPSKKTVDKQKNKIVEDKTFGLKNKKGSKNQKYIAQVEKQVFQGNKSAKEAERARAERIEKKELKEKEKDELNQLFRPVAELQKVAAGVDPKSVLCAFFKQGTCLKGAKCKFSHDRTVERKAEKRNIYDNTNANKTEDMDSWDQEKLETVVTQKHGAANKGLPPTAIICKHFLDAVENNKYGWFWECPSGPTCHYKHALPPGFVLKKDVKKMEEQKEVISLEELIEKERQNLGMELTKVTLESFMAWKKRKREEKIAELTKEKEKRRTDFKHGRTVGLSGRDLFEFNPELAKEQQDDEEGGDVFDSRLREKEEDDEWKGHVQEIDLNNFENPSGDVKVDEPLLGAQASNVDIDADLFDDPDLVDELENLEIDDEEDE